MPKFEIIYDPRSRAAATGLQEEIVADFHRQEGRFVVFCRADTEFEPADVVLQVAATMILQIKTLPDDETSVAAIEATD